MIKDNGVYVCQNCGTKYTLEEARKLIIDEPVEVQGTVKIDESGNLDNYIALAKRARARRDWDDAKKYYNLVEQIDPKNIEAIFYGNYGKAKDTLADSNLSDRQDAFKGLQVSLICVKNNFDIVKEAENRKIIDSISSDIIELTCKTNFKYNTTVNSLNKVIWSDYNETIYLFNNLNAEFMLTTETIAKRIPETNKETRIHYFETAIKHGKTILANRRYVAFPQRINNAISWYRKYINDINPNYVVR